MKKRTHISLIIISIAVILTAGSYLYILSLTRPFSSKAGQPHTARVEIPAGTSIRAVAVDMEQKHIIRSAELFYLAARYPLVKKALTGKSSPFSMKSGNYRLSDSMTFDELFTTLSSGKNDYLRVSIPEGYTLSMIGARLEKEKVCTAQSFKEAAHDPELLAAYKISSPSFEGYLFPDTYFLSEGMDAQSIVRMMADTFFARIKDIPTLAAADPQTLNTKVILASIVEREYRVAEEAPLIASVFKNRMDKNIGLYSCATIVYILTEIQGKPHPDVITYKDLQINSRYNTYKWAALPPGAISNPGMIALRAAADPPKTNYYFFRLVDPDSGRHVFSTSFSEHVSEGNRLYTKKAAR